MRIRIKDLALYSILLYIIVVMVSSSTGALAVKIIRVIVFAFLMFMLSTNKRFSKRDDYTYVLFSAVFLVYCGLRIPFAYSQHIALSSWMTLLYVILIDILVYFFLLRFPYASTKIIDTVIIGAVLKAVYIYASEGPLVFLTSRYTSDGGSANLIGFYCAISVVLGFCQRRSSKRNSKKYLLYTISMMLNIVFALLSASRKSLLYLAIPFFVWYVLKSKNPIVIIRNLIIGCTALIVMYLAIMNIGFLYNMVGHRIETMILGLIGATGGDASVNTRMLLIQEGLGWFGEEPLWGYGLGNFSPMFGVAHPHYEVAYYAHNNYIELLVDCGIIGTVLYYYLPAKSAIRFMKNRKSLSQPEEILFGILIAILICDYGIVSYNAPILQLLMAVIFSKCFNRENYDNC